MEMFIVENLPRQWMFNMTNKSPQSAPSITKKFTPTTAKTSVLLHSQHNSQKILLSKLPQDHQLFFGQLIGQSGLSQSHLVHIVKIALLAIAHTCKLACDTHCYSRRDQCTPGLDGASTEFAMASYAHYPVQNTRFYTSMNCLKHMSFSLPVYNVCLAIYSSKT